MELKKYLEFIRESIKEDIDEGNFWNIDEDDIREFLVDLEDENYLITVTFGFVERIQEYNYSSSNMSSKFKDSFKETFTEKVLPGEDVIPAYWIQIEYSSKNTTGVDVTDSVIFANDIIKEKADAEISIHDEDGKLDIRNIQLKGGLWIGKDESEQLGAREYIALFVKQKNTVEFTEKQVAEYYGLEYDNENKSGGVYIQVDLEDMADIMLERNSDYKETLVGGIEYMWDNYESHYYIPDTQSFFQYSLNKENEVLMVRSIIKEMGGLEELLTEIHFDEDMSNKSEQEVVDFLLNERFYRTLDELCKNSEMVQEIKQVVADWEMSAHVDSNYDNIISEFDDIVGKEFEFQKIEKDVWTTYQSKDPEGNTTQRGYTQSMTYYEIGFESRWVDDYDSDDLFREDSIRGIFNEWCGHQWFSHILNPRMDDYGSVDIKSLNSDIKHTLNRYLSNS